ncbi:MAG TPA: carboxypeptidase-like regulatory domain-containing protein [Thermoguttaceae bacterium]|nr:carboxypeptidase-like regulatory domain-containing protein [Thermoguttaceae bacterium]
MSRRRHLLCALFVLLATLPGTGWADEQGGVRLRFSLAEDAGDGSVEVTVSGQITDAETGKPIPDALVRGHVVVWRHMGPELFPKCPCEEARADRQGKYALRFTTRLTTSGPMEGKDGICLSASAPGYETRPLYVKPSVTPDKTTFHEVDLALGPGKLLEGTVVDEANRPIQGAVVRVQNGWNGDWNYFGSLGKAHTDENGRFETWCSTDRGNVISADPWLRIAARGYGTGFFWDLLEKESLGTLVVPRGGTIAGKVTLTEGRACPGCEVLALDAWPNEIDKTQTDDQGRYELKGVPGEAVLTQLYERKNGQKPPKSLTDVTVYARRDAALALGDVPQYAIQAKAGKTVNGPDLVIGADTSVAGKLIPSKTTRGLKGLLVALDTRSGQMVEADAEGNFRFPLVSPGKHRLTVYLPNNLRGDRGIGHTEIDVPPGKPLEGLTISLETLAEVRVQFLDAHGNPLEGVTAGATWTTSGDGFWTEGTKSDEDGWAVLYLYPGDVQYVRGFDHTDRGLVAEGYERIEPEAGQVIGNLRIAMMPAADVEGRPIDEGDAPAPVAPASGAKPTPPDREKAELMGRVEWVTMHGGRDVTARKSIEWGDVEKHENGNRSIRYKYYATIWDKDVYIMNQVFTFDPEGNPAGMRHVEGFPKKKPVKKVDTSTKEGMIELVEDFFTKNFRDITARKTIQWGDLQKHDDGSASIRYQYEATIWGRDKKIMNQVFTFDAGGGFVSVEDIKGARSPE